MIDERVCTTCIFCLKMDSGYSNWTVMETFLHCLKKLNPEMEGKEEPYRETDGDMKILDKAKTCPAYVNGTATWLDVDREHFQSWDADKRTLEEARNYADTDEAAQLLLDWMKEAKE